MALAKSNGLYSEWYDSLPKQDRESLVSFVQTQKANSFGTGQIFSHNVHGRETPLNARVYRRVYRDENGKLRIESCLRLVVGPREWPLSNYHLEKLRQDAYNNSEHLVEIEPNFLWVKSRDVINFVDSIIERNPGLLKLIAVSELVQTP